MRRILNVVEHYEKQIGSAPNADARKVIQNITQDIRKAVKEEERHARTKKVS